MNRKLDRTGKNGQTNLIKYPTTENDSVVQDSNLETLSLFFENSKSAMTN